MSISQNQRRRGRSGGSGIAAGRESTSGPSSGSDALTGLRQAVADLDPTAFARCFSADGWLRVPRPEGDLVRHGVPEIEQLGHQLRILLLDLTWTPSQRFVAAGQVVEEAVATARLAPAAARPDPGDRTPVGEIRVPMRVVAALDPAGGIGSLTLWVNWAALRDPLGVDSVHGAASALVAQARARDARGLRVIESDPGTDPVPLPTPPVPAPRAPGPPAAVLWWQQHRSTLAGSVMALAAAGVIGWVAVTTLRPIVDDRLNAADVGAGPTASAKVLGAETGNDVDPGTGATKDAKGAAPTATGNPARGPVIVRERPRKKPTVQAGDKVTFQSDVLFRTNSTDITGRAELTLRELAQRVRAERRVGNIQINGYTDAIGSERDNLQLSQARAAAVATTLQLEFAKLNVTAAVRLVPQGFGESDPVAANTNADGRERNRRVTVVLPFSKE
jgi:outer membrane protein OmpA-like peptidoglycan-associated protein